MKKKEELRLARYKLEDKEDYIRLANVLMVENRFEEAFDAVKKGLALPGDQHYRLNELYFDLAGRLLHEPGLVDFSISLGVALEMLDRQFDKEEYEMMKQVFSSTGKLEEFKSAMQRSLKNRNSIVHALLHNGELKAAMDMAHSEPEVSAGVMIEVSKAAKIRVWLRNQACLQGWCLSADGLMTARR